MKVIFSVVIRDMKKFGYDIELVIVAIFYFVFVNSGIIIIRLDFYVYGVDS